MSDMKGATLLVRNKYGAKKTVVDGICFDSKAEARYCNELLLREKAGEITGLTFHTRYRLEVNGVLIGHYTDDASFYENGKRVVCDIKGVRTRDFVLRKKLMKAIHNIDVVEVK